MSLSDVLEPLEATAEVEWSDDEDGE